MIPSYRYLIILCFCFVFSFLAQSQDYKYDTYEMHKSHLKYHECDNGRIAYLDQGIGEEVIVLLHGIPTNSWLYRHMVNDLVKLGYRVIVPDMLGFGASDKPKDLEQYHNQLQAERLLSLMDALGIPQWTHVFHDAGGLSTWEILLEKPDRIKKMVVLNTIAYMEGFKPPMKIKKRGSLKGKMFSWAYKSRLLGGSIIKKTLKAGTKDHHFTKEDRIGYRQPFRENAKAIEFFFSDFTNYLGLLKRVHVQFQSLNIPTVIIWGEEDDFLIAEVQVPLIAKGLKVAEKNIHILKNTKHFIQEEAPEKLIEIIRQFLE